MDSDGGSSASRRTGGDERGERTSSDAPSSRFFLWLDHHVAKFGRSVDAQGVEEDIEDVDEHFLMMNIDNRVTDLEARIASIEKKRCMNGWLSFVCLFVLFVVVYVGCSVKAVDMLVSPDHGSGGKSAVNPLVSKGGPVTHKF
ncbi:hypothetical protein PIB30_054782 [Stylosanthes scabra]|uniref:Uncharacterized protein n=1 Tax=Stylosanthes scabra TaxID=79078 RepID=A0ABU6RIU5_9FABA|nr:hypothetical protein [Stylosanthes scabra]